MSTPDRDNLYTATDDRRTVYTREGSGTGWFVGIIVALALIAIGYLIFAANSGTSTAPAVDGTAPMTTPADPAMAPAPMTDAAPAADPAPAAPAEAPAAVDPAPAAPAADAPAAADPAPVAQ
jgi:hypothetical protein